MKRPHVIWNRSKTIGKASAAQCRSSLQAGRTLLARLLVIGVFTNGILGCGVRGRPQPPLTPPELGHGQPTFSRATEEFAFPAVPTPAPLIEKKKSGERETN